MSVGIKGARHVAEAINPSGAKQVATQVGQKRSAASIFDADTLQNGNPSKRANLQDNLSRATQAGVNPSSVDVGLGNGGQNASNAATQANGSKEAANAKSGAQENTGNGATQESPGKALNDSVRETRQEVSSASREASPETSGKTSTINSKLSQTEQLARQADVSHKQGIAAEAQGKAKTVAGATIKKSGAVVEKSGKGMNTAGIALENSGRPLLASPFTAAAGYAMIASGKALQLTGKGLQKTGQATQKTGEGIEKTGQALQKTSGDTLRKASQQTNRGSTKLQEARSDLGSLRDSGSKANPQGTEGILQKSSQKFREGGSKTEAQAKTPANRNGFSKDAAQSDTRPTRAETEQLKLDKQTNRRADAASNKFRNESKTEREKADQDLLNGLDKSDARLPNVGKSKTTDDLPSKPQTGKPKPEAEESGNSNKSWFDHVESIGGMVGTGMMVDQLTGGHITNAVTSLFSGGGSGDAAAAATEDYTDYSTPPVPYKSGYTEYYENQQNGGGSTLGFA